MKPFPLIDYSIQQRALDGSPKHIEAYLRMTGRWNDGGYGPPQPVGTPAEGGNQGVQVGSVTFVNVPISPTPQEADARRPPPGSNIITPAPALPPMPVRAARKDFSRG